MASQVTYSQIIRQILAEHTQSSVFECDLSSESFIDMMRIIRLLVYINIDHAHLYRFCALDVRNIYRIGGLTPVKDKPFDLF